MPVLEGYENADTPHAKTVMAPGWTYGCHSSKTGDKPRGGPSTYRVQVGQRFTLDCGSMEATAVQISRPHTTHWLDTNPDGTPLKCGHEAKARLADAQCIGCANRE
jgi:hypothetical protein